MNYKDLPMRGEPTPDELQLTGFLMDGIAHFVSQKPTDRRVLIAALSQICKQVFCVATPYPVKEQCAEIEAFCCFLLEFAMKDAVRS